MGNLAFFDIAKYGKDFDVFIETGTGKGESLYYAMNTGCFHSLLSIEYVRSLYLEAKKMFRKNENVFLMHGVSWKALEANLPYLKQTNRCVFWLDAHFPGADYGLCAWDDEKNMEIRMPLLKELEAIKKARDGNDIILIDDLRLYVKDDFKSGNLEDKFMANGYDEIIAMFQDTHNITRHLNDDGYLELIPKEKI